jgi:Mce-associated membrane protein
VPPVRRSGPAGPRPPRRPRVAGTRIVGPAGPAGPAGDDEDVVDAPAQPLVESTRPPAPTAAPVDTPAVPESHPEPEPVAPELEPEPVEPHPAPEPAISAVPTPPVVIRKVPRATPVVPGESALGEPAPEGTAAPATDPGATPPARRRGLRTAAVMAVLAVLLGAFAVVAALEPGVGTAAGSGNTALVDTAATDEVAAAAVDVLQKTYSYSFSTIDADLTAATDLMTPEMASKIEATRATTVSAVTQAKTTSKAQVTADGVKLLQGDRAEVVAFVVVTSDNAGTALAPVPLRFTAQLQRVDGTWKLADLTPL